MVDVELMDLEIVLQGGVPAWRAHVVADGMPICRMAGSPDELVVLSWFRGCDGNDLAALEEAIAADGVPRLNAEGSPRPDTLFERCADIVSTAMLEQEMRRIFGDAILFTIPGQDREGARELLTVAIPADGTSDGAIAHVRRRHPDAAILNEMPIDEAIDAYLATLDLQTAA